MKNESEIKEAMNNVKTQLTESNHEQTIMLQGQFAALRWVLDEKEAKPDE